MKVEIYPGASDEETEAELGSQTVPKTIEKQFKDVLYDQNLVNPY